MFLYSFFILLFFSSFYCDNAASSSYLPTDFQSIISDNIFTFQGTTKEYYNLYDLDEFAVICTDEELELTCFYTASSDYNYFSGETVYYSNINCVSYTSDFSVNLNILPRMTAANVAYNYPQHSLIYWDTNGNLTAFNLQTNTTIFSQYYNCTDVFNNMYDCDVSTTKLNNGNIFYVYRDSLSFLEARNFSNFNLISSISLYTSLFTLFDYGSNIAVGIVFFPSDNMYGFSVLDPSSLNTVCEGHVISNGINQIYGNNMYINVGTDSPDLYTYSGNCTALWRIPIYDRLSSVAYDVYNNFYAFFYYTEYVNNEFKSYINIYQIPLSSTPPSDLKYITVDSNFQFVGIDSTSHLFFVNGTETDLYIYTYSYDSWKNKTSSEYKISDMDSTKFKVLSLIPSGLQVLIDNIDFQGVLSIQSDSNEWWKITDIVTYIFLPLTFIYSICIMIKHLLRGEDAKGWNKAKLFDVGNSLLVCFSIIFITITISIAQVQLVSDINTNTVAFDNDLGGLYTNYLQPSCSQTTSDPVDLCTCDDRFSQYHSSSCVSSSCPGSTNSYCSTYLSNTCDCYHSVYEWNCNNCQYFLNNTCGVDLVTTSTYTTQANNQWKKCQDYYHKPTLILNINFYVLIGSAIILVILNIIQIILKFDVPIFDLILTVSSIVLAFLQFLLILIGNIYVSLSNGGNCTSQVLSLLPGCILTSNNVLSMETLSYTYLHNAYSNLYASPTIFIISAIPDLLSLFCCMGIYNFYKLSKGYETIGTESKNERVQTIIIFVCIIISAIVTLLIFLVAASLFFVSIFCRDNTNCDINSTLLEWFFIIGLVPGSIISLCVCCFVCLCVIGFMQNK